MIDFGVHLLDTTLWLMGNPQPIEVCASISQHLGKAPNVNPWGQWNYREFTVEDQAAVFIRFVNGASMLLECSWALNIPENYENVSLSGTAAGLEVFPLKVNKAHLDMLVSWKPDWMPGERDNPGDVQTADFVGAILEGRQPVSCAWMVQRRGDRPANDCLLLRPFRPHPFETRFRMRTGIQCATVAALSGWNRT
jgi:predicted dehydrogenase